MPTFTPFSTTPIYSNAGKYASFTCRVWVVEETLGLGRNSIVGSQSNSWVERWNNAEQCGTHMHRDAVHSEMLGNNIAQMNGQVIWKCRE